MLHLCGMCACVVAFVDRSVPVSTWKNGHFLSQLRGYSAWLRDDASSRATQLTVECLLWVAFVVFVVQCCERGAAQVTAELAICSAEMIRCQRKISRK